MKIDYDNIKSQYEEKTTGDLFDRHKSSTLSDKADEIVESVLAKRGKKVPERPKEIRQITRAPLPSWLQIPLNIFLVTIFIPGISLVVEMTKPIVTFLFSH